MESFSNIILIFEQGLWNTESQSIKCTKVFANETPVLTWGYYGYVIWPESMYLMYLNGSQEAMIHDKEI